MYNLLLKAEASWSDFLLPSITIFRKAEVATQSDATRRWMIPFIATGEEDTPHTHTHTCASALTKGHLVLPRGRRILYPFNLANTAILIEHNSISQRERRRFSCQKTPSRHTNFHSSILLCIDVFDVARIPYS